MNLKLYDTLTKEKRAFVPLDPDNVRMYVCGPTVYDLAHIGNARPVIVFDVLFRLLRHLYGEGHVKYVRNITDVDDKINARAARDFPGLPLNEAIGKVTQLTEKQFHDDVDALGCLRPTVEPRATEHIAEMRMLIERLVQGGFAYVAEDHVLFSPQAMNGANSILPRYGILANRSLDEMIAGARVDVAPYKRDATDFVLWKPAKAGEPSWPSPAGIEVQGRPGWHIECSAMAWKHLGEQFDIHGGGIDLVFPHHENELAQTCCAFHQARMADIWMHNGFLQVEGAKMSKSEGNFVTIRELLADWPGEVLRLNMLKTHYRSPVDWTIKGLGESWREIREWALQILAILQLDEPIKKQLLKFETPNLVGFNPSSEVIAALKDDLNTPAALTALRKRKLNCSCSISDALQLLSDLKFLGVLSERTLRIYTRFINENVQALALFRSEMNALGTASANRDAVRIEKIISDLRERGAKVDEVVESCWTVQAGGPAADAFNKKIQTMIEDRLVARSQKDWAKSDRIRDQLAAMGIALKDSKNGTEWSIAQ